MGQTTLALALLVYVACAAPRAAAQNCPPGKFSASGMAPCTPCAPGTYQPASGQTACRECVAGRYQSQAGKSYCLSCPVGTYAARTGTSVCTVCAPGTFQPLVGSTECMPCPRGTYQDESGRALCDPCPGDVYSEAGAAKCRSCPPPQTAKGDCTAQVCAGGEVIDLVDVKDIPDDGVDCTHDGCDEDGQPTHVPDAKACNDGDPCTGDSCKPSGCEHASVLACGGDHAPNTGGAAGRGGDAGPGAVRAVGGDASVPGARDAVAQNDGGARRPHDALEGGCGCRVGARSRRDPSEPIVTVLIGVFTAARRLRTRAGTIRSVAHAPTR